MNKVSYKRHLAKTATWRVIGTLDTILLSYLITGELSIGVQIGTIELATKMILYYIHERLWVNIPIENSRFRHFLKTLTWRFIGTLDTVLISWVISGNPIIGLKIGGIEMITKMILYYVHERIWYYINFGLQKRRQRQCYD